MNSKIEKLPSSRVKISITAQKDDLAHAAEHALSHVTSQVAVKGFRPGKAPKPMLVAQVGKGRILSELVDHALPEFLQKTAQENKLAIIETPKYTLEKLCELDDNGLLKADTKLIFSAEADVAPEITVGDYRKLKVKPTKQEQVTEAVINETLNQLAERRAEYKPTDLPATKGDKVEIDFRGKRNGIPEERLTSQNHPIILGSQTMIPGFEDSLIGKKAGEKASFEITFPKDYHTKDLASEKVVFDVTVHRVLGKKQPVIDDAFAESFGHKKIDALKNAIQEEREFTFAGQAKQATEAAVLDAFEPIIKAELPLSLIEREIDRQVEAMREQAKMYGLSFDHYLEHIKKTEEELRNELRPTAEKAVKIGLGLSDVVAREKLESAENQGVAAIAKLVEIATVEG